jgi:hypothetical protein
LIYSKAKYERYHFQVQKITCMQIGIISLIKDLYSRKDMNLSLYLAWRDFYATTEQTLNHSFWNALWIRMTINQLHQSSCYASSIYYTTQHNLWICRYRFNGKAFCYLFCITPHTRKKSTVKFHTSKHILKMIKQRNQSRQVLFYISNTHLYTLVCRLHVNK